MQILCINLRPTHFGAASRCLRSAGARLGELRKRICSLISAWHSSRAKLFRPFQSRKARIKNWQHVRPTLCVPSYYSQPGESKICIETLPSDCALSSRPAAGVCKCTLTAASAEQEFEGGAKEGRRGGEKPMICVSRSFTLGRRNLVTSFRAISGLFLSQMKKKKFSQSHQSASTASHREKPQKTFFPLLICRGSVFHTPHTVPRTSTYFLSLYIFFAPPPAPPLPPPPSPGSAVCLR